jgi:antitoxin MazE
MQVQLSKWGNSLGLRIPKSVAQELGLTEGAHLDIKAEDGRIVVSHLAPRYRIEDLVADLSHEEVSEAFDWGPDEGREGTA